MQGTGRLDGVQMLRFVDFPGAEVLGPSADEEKIEAMIERHGEVFVKPVFRGGIGKKGKAGLLGRAMDLATALRERLFVAEHRFGAHGAQPLYVITGRGGPNLVRGFGALRDTGEALGLDFMETAAFAVFLHARMIGCAAEIDDHMNRGRNMDTRTAASQCRFVS